MALDGLRRPVRGHMLGPLAELGHEPFHALAVGRVLGGRAVGPRIEDGHYERLGSMLAIGIAYARIGT